MVKNSWILKFGTSDNLLLNKPLKFVTLTVVARSVFLEYGQYCPAILFRWMLVWVINARIR